MSFSVSEGSLKRKTPKIKEFLSGLELDFDDLITYSVIIEEEGQIVATGSIHENVLKCIAVAKEHQGKGYMATVVTYLANEMVRRGISHYFVFTKPENLRIFADLGFYQIICTDDVLFMENTKNGILNYVNLLKEESFCAKGEKIGAIIANCNPFTNGHEYLIETASEKCDVLHLFVLSS